MRRHLLSMSFFQRKIRRRRPMMGTRTLRVIVTVRSTVMSVGDVVLEARVVE
jgi:hypothetical protein